MSELAYKGEAASVYDRAFAHVSTHFLPFLLRAARLVPGQRVLDAATGTGIAAQAPLAVVGPGGHVTAADISLAMVNRARQRLAGSPNASVVVEDGQSLSFANASFDAVLCSLGLMFFPDPARGLSRSAPARAQDAMEFRFGQHYASALVQRSDQRQHRPPRAGARGSYGANILPR